MGKETYTVWVPNRCDAKLFRAESIDAFGDDRQLLFEWSALIKRPKKNSLYDKETFPWKRCTITVEVE
jgi:hypothetical protein